ncbi:MAG TPA: glycosyltransferase family 4 protein [Geminicoccaceae bacterium]
MEPRHVVLIANTGWNVVRFRAELIAGLLEAGWQVSTIAAFSDEDLDRLQSLGARPVRLAIDAAGRNPVRDLIYLGQLARCIRRLRPDLVHLFTIKPVIWGALAAKVAGVPGVVASLTGAGILRADDRPWLGHLLRPLVRRALSGRPEVVFQNLDDMRTFVAAGMVGADRATHIAGSGIDTLALVPDLSRPAAERTTFVMASRMLWSKGVADFVAAARLVRRRHPAARFVLFGGAREDYGSKNPDFIERPWLEGLNREGVVEWRGWTRPSDVEAAMRGAAAVVLPSYYAEGVPRALIEATSAGVPVITTDLPGCRDTVLEGRSGFLVPPRAPARLAAAMVELLRDPERAAAMGREGRRLAAARFDKRIILARTLAVYERALAPGPHRRRAPAPIARS